MLTLNDFKAIQNAVGVDTLNDAKIREAKESLKRELVTSVHFMRCKRNGVEQSFVVTPSEAYHKYEIEALPDEHLFVGDEIECMNEHWIVVKTRVASPFQTIGLMWLCNYKFRWQNHTPEIIERWGVLDSGVYSTTRDGDGNLVTPDKQFKLYFPKDPDTAKLYIDKRLAVEVIYDSRGDEVLNVYRITGYDSISSSYGQGGHLLVLNARSEDYVPGRDSIEEMICDYITPEDEPEPSEGTITGPAQLRAGTARTYTADFHVTSWTCSPVVASVVITPDGNDVKLFVALDDDMIGETVTLSAAGTDPDEQPISATFDVEVVV